MYSYICRIEKYIPSKIVIIILLILCVNLFIIIDWCLQVIEIPEHKRIIVLSIGILIGLNTLIPNGGHFIPSSILGDNLLWRKVQKNEIKKKISDTMNKIIPHFIIKDTIFVWFPWKVDSRTMSRHHWNADNKVIIKPKIINDLSIL